MTCVYTTGVFAESVWGIGAHFDLAFKVPLAIIAAILFTVRVCGACRRFKGCS